jgi:hypothetical protein
VAQRAHLATRDGEFAHMEELDIGNGLARYFLHDFLGVRALDLVAIDATAAARIEQGALVALGPGVIAPCFEVVLHPVQRRGATDEHEAFGRQVEQDRVADHVAVGVAGNELFGRIDSEALERIYAERGK